MFEVGWTEMLVIAIVMIVVVGPKDLPNMLRTFGRTTAKLRAMAADFQKQFNEALKEAELDTVKKDVEKLARIDPMADLRKDIAKTNAEIATGIAKPDTGLAKIAADTGTVEPSPAVTADAKP